MKEYTLTVTIEVEDDDTRSHEEIEKLVQRALFTAPEVPYLEFTDITLEKEDYRS